MPRPGRFFLSKPDRMPANRIIDFQPTEFGRVIRRERHIALMFPSQAMYFDGCYDTGVISSYRCELRIWDAKLLLPAARVPAQCDNVTVEYRGGSRRCFLPVGFRVRGPVKVIFEFEGKPGKDLPIAEGSAVTLRVIRKTKEEKVHLLTMPDQWWSMQERPP